MVLVLEDYNPWWNDIVDPVYEEWKQSPVKWMPDIVNQFTDNPFSLNFLVGPRQVGKSTALRIFIHELLKDGLDPQSVLYLSCENITDFKELAKLIDQFMEDTTTKQLIILDEITFVKDWWRAIKDFIDRRIFIRTTLYISGSASMEIIRQKEYFPGRRGSGQDFELLPLDFNAYCRHIGKLVPLNYKLDNPNVYSQLRPLKLKSKSYTKLFNQYLITGGFPHPIIEYMTTSQVSQKSYKVYVDWIRNDVVRMGKSESFLKEIINSIIQSGTAPISYQGIAKNTTIGSVSTVSSYLDLLSNLFVLHLQTFRYSDGRISGKKNRKIHIQDPFLLDALAYYTQVDVNVAEKVESCVASHLARISNIYYWRAKTEVDIITELPFGTFGVEVKWSNRIRKRPIYREPNSFIVTLDKQEIALFLGHYQWKNAESTI